MLGGDITTEGRFHTSGRWITFPLGIAGIETLWMVLDTGSPLSAVSPTIRDYLERQGLLRQSGRGNLYLLGRLTMAGHQVPDLEIGVVVRLERLQIEGVLGLDFLANYEDIHFNVPTLRLTLSPATPSTTT